MRTALGDAMTLYADANSGYDAREGIRIGKLLEASSLKCARGSVRCPSGTRFGVTLDPKFVSQATKLESGA